jgi:GT2 family glycosyltransferase
VVHERALLDEVGLFDESLTSHEDWDLWIRLSRRWPFAHLKVVTGEFTWRTDGSTMTSRMAADYRRTIEIIHARYRDHAERVPGLVDAQRRFRACFQTAAETPRFDYSVIMPVHNRRDLTQQCIEALARVTGDVQWELIVVDNGSTDDTTAFLPSVRGDLQVIRNAENLGFATACNQGAAAARGRHLVFLNNDTVPLPGWLAALGREIDSHAEVAVVGSKLLYRDGTVQHAGLAFARRIPLPYHIYSRWPADDPAVNARREVQAVTGACMLVRREAFETVGGFDTGYRNGFEDVDLCLRIRDQGWRVVYQPESVLYHFEGQTPGRKLHDAANGRRFLERWGSRWWLADEDAIYVGDNRAARLVDCAGARRLRVEPLTDGRERQRWELVAAVQRAGQRQDLETVRALLARLEEWPDDPGVREWAATISMRVGIPERAPAASPGQERAGGPHARGAPGGDRDPASPV